MKNMAIHEMALLVSFLGVSVDAIAELDASGAEIEKFEFPDENTQKNVDELCAEDPNMMSYFFVQTDDYLQLKERVVNSTWKGADAEGVATIQIAIDALKLAEYCTEEVNKALKRQSLWWALFNFSDETLCSRRCQRGSQSCRIVST